VRRDDLLKPDVRCEVILLGSGVILILILVLTLTQASAPVSSRSPALPPRSGRRLAGILALASVSGKLDPETLLRIGNPFQGGHGNCKQAITKSAD
jgi:hypothetical protein